MKILKILVIPLISVLLYCCGDATAPVAGDVPYNLTVEKTSTGIVKISWLYDNSEGDTLEFFIAKKVGEEPWDEYFAQVDSDTFEYFDYIPTDDSLVYAYKVRYYNLETALFSQYSEADAYMSANTAPYDVEVETVDQSNVEISWFDRCVGEEGYYVDKKIGNGNWNNKYFKLAENTTEVTDEAALFDTLYYRVSAYFGSETSPSAQDSLFQTLLSPSGLYTVVLDEDKIRLNWTDNSTGEDGFSIDRKVGDDDWNNEYTVVDSNVTTYVDDIEFQCATLYYRVRAFQDTLFSVYSEVDTININLQIVGEVQTPGNALEVYFSDWTAFVSDEYYGLAVIDCFQPNVPEVLGYYELADRTLSSYVIGNIAYVATHSTPTDPGRIHKLDIASLTEPVLIGYSDTQGIPKNIFVSGDYAYIAEGNAGFSIIYIAGSDLHQVANYDLENARDVFVSGNYAYVAEGIEGLKIFDITDHANPVLVGEEDTSGSFIDIHVVGDYAYVADGENGMKIIDVSDQTNPTEVSRIDTDGYVYGVWAEEGFAYFVDKELGFYVIDASDYNHPDILGNIEMNSEPISICVVGSYAYITDNVGLKIIQVKP
ncbi:MAG: hypothetical protein K9N09_06420 [Candidatus Cloacimonetes bacterium]|nr:hypothetical protein [Candidatus Cloacimonadota bacterium]MCF7813641.1 hypothetical protein [Candidatus Cloacimonadota bacterium]MCF7868320.1 hypothetical protein [Candidatus Cloacimonadota bacterium]MCF7883794.1 hypothetical protein [Candidatus Cloacimonadota bacterium]